MKTELENNDAGYQIVLWGICLVAAIFLLAGFIDLMLWIAE